MTTATEPTTIARPARIDVVTGGNVTANSLGGLLSRRGPWRPSCWAGLSWTFGSWLQPRLWLPRDPFVLVVSEMLVSGGLLATYAHVNTWP